MKGKRVAISMRLEKNTAVEQAAGEKVEYATGAEELNEKKYYCVQCRL
jgi:hypothetical protein